MTGFEVLRAGPQTLLQDSGRTGWQHLGVSPAGPVDTHAAAWANRLLNNPWGSPLLEVALGGLSLLCRCDTWVSVTGADMPVSLEGCPQMNWSRFAVRAGQQLQIGAARTGQRAYLAVAGGFIAQPQLGSVATQQREGLGGLHADGTALQSGDRLHCRPASLPKGASVPWDFKPDYSAEPQVRVIPGGDVRLFADEQLAGFLQHTWRISPHSDRMGVRLYGTALSVPLLPACRQWSQGVSAGTIQVPPDGQPIILMADRQSMGGYPLIGWVHPLDLGLLAQSPAHHGVRFVPTTLVETQRELQAFYRFFGR